MIQTVRSVLNNPQKRTQMEIIVSSVLIAAGFIARYAFQLDAVHNLLMTLATIVAGADIAARAVKSLLNRHISIELLVTVAAAGALIIGEVWEAAAVTFLFILGAHLEARTLSRTRRVLGELLDLAPLTALVLRNGQQVEVSPLDVQIEETVLLKPGAKVPVDGEIIAGASAVDESMITGEPIPADKTVGDTVFAGTINLMGMLQVRVTGTGADTTLARIIARVEEAQEEKAPTQRFIEKFSSWYTPAIIVMSVVVYFITRQIELALTLLVIACPGALVISTPVSVIAGIGQAARRGILIKGGEHLENAGKISALALDKTGTITIGKPYVSDVIVFELAAAQSETDVFSKNQIKRAGSNGLWSPFQQEVLYWAGIAEAGSEHPLARAIYAEAQKVNYIPTPDASNAYSGNGIDTSYQGREIQVGKRKWLEEQNVNFPADIDDLLIDLHSKGKTAVFVALDGWLIGILAIRDQVRSNAAEAIQRLRASGVQEVVMLTGDNVRAAQAVAAEVGLPSEKVYAELLPEDKLSIIRALQRQGHTVAMIGDGINDAPALASADVGIAMGAAGSGVAIETADIALMSDDLGKVAEAVRLSRATLSNIRQNLVIALVTVSVLIAGVLLGEVYMAGGMLVHQASVLVVIFNGMRLLRQ